jgi:SdrD B-like domain
MTNKIQKSKKIFNLAKISHSKKIHVKVLSLLILLVFIIGNIPTLYVSATGTLSGTVFQDYNGNGVLDTAGSVALPAIDVGVQDVTVTVYAASGASKTVNTLASGAWSINTATAPALPAGPYRVEFTNLPANFQPSARSTDSVLGGATTDAGSTVQFVNDGTTSNINLAINLPEDFCQNNPEIASCNYSAGNQTVAPSSTNTALLTFPYTAGSNDTATTAPTANFDLPDYKLTTNSLLNVPASQIGTTFGLAYARSTKLLYAGAFFKRHTGFGTGVDNTINTSDDAGAVYVINRTGNSNKGAVVNKFTVPNATTNRHNTADYQTDNGNTGWDGVGKTSLGGMAIASDDSALYVMNLENRTLYRRDLATNTFTSQVVPTTGLTTANGTCAAADVRPFAVTYYRGEVYVGMLCSGESSATVDSFTDVAGGTTGVYDPGENYLDSNNNGSHDTGEPFDDVAGGTAGTYDGGDTLTDVDGNGVYNLGDARKLTVYVYKVNAATLAFGASPAFSTPLNYKRGISQKTRGGSVVWRPWSNVYANANVTGNRVVYSQPILTGITFDQGNLILGLRDRAGDQIGHQTQSNPNDVSATLYQPRTGGDTLRACGNPTSGWTVEANGRCGGVGSSTQNTRQGPGGGEFYNGDSFTLDAAYSQPASQPLLVGKGSNHDELSLGGVAQMPGAPDALATIFDPIPNVGGETHDGGVRWLNNTTGSFSKAYRIYNGDTGTLGTLGKSNGIGDLEFLCDSAPIELGNRVWRDTNNNGVQDPGENGIAGVTVHLYNAANVLIATAVTDANGEYYFTSGTAADGDTTDNIGIVNGAILPNANYQIRLDLPADYASLGPLNGRFLTIRDQTSQPGFDDGSDSDGVLVASPVGSPSGGFPVIAVTTGGAGNNNHNSDFGFSATPTAANVSVGGRAVSPSGSGLRGVFVTLREANGTSYTTVTNSFGYYLFNEIQAGQIITVGVESKRYVFNQPTQIINLSDNIADLQFTSTSR